MAWPALAIAVALLLGSGCVDAPETRTAAAEGTTRTRDACGSPSYPGPWTACSDAQEVRRTLEGAGFDVFFDQGAAWHATDHKTASFSVGVIETRKKPHRSRPVVETVDGIPIRGGRLRIAWYVNGRAWWLEPQGAPPEDGRPNPWHLRLPEGDVLARLVRASRAADIASAS